MTFILVLFSCQTGACLKCAHCVFWSSLMFWSPENWFERSIHVSLGVSARHGGEWQQRSREERDWVFQTSLTANEEECLEVNWMILDMLWDVVALLKRMLKWTCWNCMVDYILAGALVVATMWEGDKSAFMKMVIRGKSGHTVHFFMVWSCSAFPSRT